MAVHKTSKKVVLISSVCIVLVLVIIAIVANIGGNYDYKNKTYLFDTVEDLNFLNDKVVEENIKDGKLGNLSYNSGRSVRVKYDGNEYKLFAYEFNAKEDVFAYGQAVSGNDYARAYEQYGDKGWYYSRYVAIIAIPVSNTALVFSGNNVLAVEAKTSKKKFNRFIDYLFTNLPQKVEVIAY